MDLIDRYVVEVARHLPRASATDIASELHSSLGDALDAREAAAGRHADPDMVAALLREFGHPEAVADRYRPPRALIGPAWYPSFEYIALTVASVVATLKIGGFAIRTIVSGTTAGDALTALGELLTHVFVGVATTAFVIAALERVSGDRAPEDGYGPWDPLLLPATEDADDAGRLDSAELERGIWGNAVMLVLLLAFPQWLGMPWGYQYRFTIVSLSDLGFRLPVLWLGLFWAGSLVVDAVLLRRQRWTGALRGADLALAVVGALTLGMMLWTAGPPRIDEAWLAARAWALDDPDRLRAGTTMHRLVLAGMVAMLAWQLYTIVRRARALVR